MHWIPTRLPLVLSAFTLAACGDAEVPDSVLVRDSAGIALVDVRAGANVPSWTLESEPVVTIGASAGAPEYELFQALDGRVLDDDRILIANRGSHELRLYDAAGRHLKSVGREGGGPGEYENMGGLVALPGDTLAVWDWGARRLTLYDDTLGLARILTPTTGDGMMPRVVGVFDDGTLAMTDGLDVIGAFAAGSGLREDSVTVLRASPMDGAVLDTLGPYPGQQSYAEVTGSSLRIDRLPFGRQERVVAGPGGLVVGDDRVGEVRVYAADGRLVRIVRLPPPPDVTDSDMEAYRQRALAEVEPEREPETRRRLDRVPAAETHPAFGLLYPDRLGRLWIQEPGADDARTRSWTVLDPDGTPSGRLTVPAEFTPLDAGPDFVLFHTQDELEVERVVLYGVSTSGTPDARS